MNTLKISFKNFWPEWNDENFISPILQKYFNISIDDNNPDIIFCSIFGNHNNLSKYNCKKILFLGENHRPSNYNCDYSISFDINSNTNFQLPLWQVYILNNPLYKDLLFNKIKHNAFDRFCSFTVSNPSNFVRNSMYHSLSKIDRVYSYGRYMNNSNELLNLSKNRYWRDAKFDFFNDKKHKFSICFENNSYPYYCTEKLMDAYLSGSIPIYYGDPKVDLSFNSESFINVMKLGVENSIQLIDKMNKDNDLFLEMYNKQIFTEEQKNKLESNLNNFENWLIEKI